MKKYIGAVVVGSALLSIPSCSDTWDEHYVAGEGATNATESLWDLISSKPELSRFKEIAEKTPFYRDETHPQANYTFKDMLQTSMLTAWVPENSAISDAEYQNLLAMTETKGYTVQQQFLGNTIALWRQIATGEGIDTLTMLNGKKVPFDRKAFTIQGIDLEEKNIAANNGTLHTIKTQLPFKYNLYEYLKDADNAAANSLNSFHDYIVSRDTSYFDEDRSVEGTPDAYGEPTYVDSVNVKTNTLFFGTHRYPSNTNTERYLTFDESFGANIIAEDSTFIMVFPTDNALANARTKLEGYYKYASKYEDKSKGNESDGKTKVFLPKDEDGKPVTIDTDSLKEKCLTMDLYTPLCYNLHTQPNAGGEIGRWKLDQFLAENGKSAEYFLNTFGDTLRSDSAWDKTTLLQGKQVPLSNGVAIIADEWNIPAKLYKPDINVEIDYRSLYQAATLTTKRTRYTPISFSNTVASAWIDSVGRVSENNFYYVESTTTNDGPQIQFKLRGTSGNSDNLESEVMSGKYDIYAVMVPDFYMSSKESIVYNNRTGFIKTVNDSINDTIPLQHKIRAKITYCEGNPTGTDKESEYSVTVDYDGKKVQEVLLFKDFEFPFSYKNLLNSYPTIMITSDKIITAKEIREKGYSRNFCIDRIILRSKD